MSLFTPPRVMVALALVGGFVSSARAQQRTGPCPTLDTFILTEDGLPRSTDCLFDERGQVKAAILEHSSLPGRRVVIYSDSAPYNSVAASSGRGVKIVELPPGVSLSRFDDLASTTRELLNSLGSLPVPSRASAENPAVAEQPIAESTDAIDSVILARYEYDFLGRVRKKIGEEGVRQYVYDGDSNRVLSEHDEHGALVASYTWAGDRLGSITRSGVGTVYPTFDGLGSVASLNDAQGAVVARNKYDAWGNFRLHEESFPNLNSHGFTGHRWEPNIGLYSAKARFYDPEVGRFTSQDSYLGEISDPPSLHRYFYANDRPTFFIDPTGHAGSDAQARHFGRPPEERLKLTETERHIGQSIRDLGPNLLKIAKEKAVGLALAFGRAETFASGSPQQIVAESRNLQAESAASIQDFARHEGYTLRHPLQATREATQAAIELGPTRTQREILGAGVTTAELVVGVDGAITTARALRLRGAPTPLVVTETRAGSTALAPAETAAARRVFDNLYPEEGFRNVPRSLLEQRDGKWVEVTPSGEVRSATGRYNYVVQDGTMYGSRIRMEVGQQQAGHADLARGSEVDFAGEVTFSGRTNRGQVRNWNNASGHYTPDPTAAPQAGLPMEQFQPRTFDTPPQLGRLVTPKVDGGVK
jgi:RHS repeat-associated protein